MCGIVGYTGMRRAQPILFDSLSRLEYRGYDSCGIALGSPELKVYKDAIRVEELTRSLPDLNGTVGIGHTRWATRGAPNKLNAHPHHDCTGRIAVVHNGMINNCLQLRLLLSSEGHKFISETDTEVIAHLIEKCFQGNLEDAVEKALRYVIGSYAIVVICENTPELVVAKKDSSLIIGVGDGEHLVASDVTAILEYTNSFIYLEEGDIGRVTPSSVTIKNGGKTVNRQMQKITWTNDVAEKNGFEHFMLKEIHEQPQVIRHAIEEYFFSPVPLIPPSDIKLESISILACGTSYHAGLVGKFIFEELLGIPVRLDYASEFNYFRHHIITPVTIAISQSGETADTVKAMKRLKEAGSQVIAITNVVGSMASKIANHVIYTHAGPEISVASTKSFTAQLVALYWMAISLAKFDSCKQDEIISKLIQLPAKTKRVLDGQNSIKEHAEKLSRYDNVFFVGRGINYAIALEGALKLKEISYIHSEAYAAGELKHGPFALLDKNTPVVAIISNDATRDALITNMKEIKARKSPVFAIDPEGDDEVKDAADFVIPVPQTDPLFSTVVNAVVVQLLAYYAAKKRGCPIDFPRNLAKSITVE